MDSEQILNLIANQIPPGASQRPRITEAMALGLDYEEDASEDRVVVTDRRSETVLEWHRCRDLEPQGEVLRCRHVNGDGTRCTRVYGSVPPYAEASRSYTLDRP